MINNIYALREALAMLTEEGIEAAWARHAAAAAQLHVRARCGTAVCRCARC